MGRCISDRSYRDHIWERAGIWDKSGARVTVQATEPNSVWLHAVSVGEIASAVPLIRRLRGDRPRVPIFVSTSTVAGRRAAAKQLAGLVSGVFYAPLDFASMVRRVLRRIRPGLVIVLETEIWPNLYEETKRSGAKLVLVNARISNRTWPRYRRWGWFFRTVLPLADAVFVQSATDVTRYQTLGLPEGSVASLGNLKYDAAVGMSDLPRLGVAELLDMRLAETPQKVWIAASTVGPNERGSVERHEIDEDALVIKAFGELAQELPKLLLLLAPRQPARFDAVAGLLRRAGIPFVRRTERNAAPLPLPGVLLLDTIGELAKCYRTADVAFVGGSLAPRGGHNVLEAAAAGVPVVVGPSMQNFETIFSDLREAGALLQVGSPGELVGAVRELLRDRDRSMRMGEAGRRVVQTKAGLANRIAPRVWRLYDEAFPVEPMASGRLALLGGLARIWESEARRRRARGMRCAKERERLGVPVISVGGIAVGGSGKTPLADQLARRLREDGWAPGILTRGYRRRSTAERILLAPGTQTPPGYTGDEARIFLSSGNAALGIGAERYQTAQQLLKLFPKTNVLILDDGFQHTRMPRDVDLVLLDGMDPWGGRGVMPLGRLREPVEVLRHASMVVVTRAEEEARFAAIVARVREVAGQVPVFRARTRCVGWRDPFTNEAIGGPGKSRAAAFCGLGNPANFWSTLQGLQIEPLFQWSFRDHHRYRVNEVHALLKLARAYEVRWLLTTQKDCNNLPEGTASWLKDLRLAWLDIEIRIEDEERFFFEMQKRFPR